MTNFTLLIILYRTNLKGYWFEHKECLFDMNQIQEYIKRLNNKNREFYNDKVIWDSICKVERGKVSNKLRFLIYSRDNYTCQICGKSGIDHDLEIDHIKPISKGGKSECNNLQTLCKKCNKLKGDKY